METFVFFLLFFTSRVWGAHAPKKMTLTHGKDSEDKLAALPSTHAETAWRNNTGAEPHGMLVKR